MQDMGPLGPKLVTPVLNAYIFNPLFLHEVNNNYIALLLLRSIKIV